MWFRPWQSKGVNGINIPFLCLPGTVLLSVVRDKCAETFYPTLSGSKCQCQMLYPELVLTMKGAKSLPSRFPED